MYQQVHNNISIQLIIKFQAIRDLIMISCNSHFLELDHSMYQELVHQSSYEYIYDFIRDVGTCYILL